MDISWGEGSKKKIPLGELQVDSTPSSPPKKKLLWWHRRYNYQIQKEAKDWVTLPLVISEEPAVLFLVWNRTNISSTSQNCLDCSWCPHLRLSSWTWGLPSDDSDTVHCPFRMSEFKWSWLNYAELELIDISPYWGPFCIREASCPWVKVSPVREQICNAQPTALGCPHLKLLLQRRKLYCGMGYVDKAAAWLL